MRINMKMVFHDPQPELAKIRKKKLRVPPLNLHGSEAQLYPCAKLFI